MDELECMREIERNLEDLVDKEARVRVVNWASAKYGGFLATTLQKSDMQIPPVIPTGILGEKIDEIPGIAKLSNSGEVLLTVRDFKARSANEAALRLVHVYLWAAGKLKGQRSVSSKSSVVPALRRYRCYDGNTRRVLAKEKGVLRDGDELSLDFHAEQLAEKFVKEILDPGTEGKWKPIATKRRASKPAREMEDATA
jgi:hypothetical protein